MNKKKIVKLGVCSLLVGLLALTACGKKTTKDSTTVKPTTVPTPITTNKSTTKKTTTQKTTTEEQKQVKSFNVYVDNVLAPADGDNAVIEFDYSDKYDYYKHLKVELVYDDDTIEVIDKTKYNVLTNLKDDSNSGMYSLAVSYGTFDAVNIDIIINKKKIDVSNLRWNSGSVNYNGTEQVKTLLNLPKGVIATYEGNKATNVGDYTASATLSLDEEAEVNYYLEETTVPNCTWSILQAVASVDVYDASKVYDGEAVDIKYYCGIKGVVPTFKYRVAGSEAAFTTDVPVDAGEYEVEVSVGWSENYIGFVSTSTFTIHKKILKVPYGNNPNNESMKVTKYTGSDQTVELEGLDLDLMEVVVIDDEVSQKDPGYYFYNVRIKDEYQTNYAFDGLNSFDAIPYTWVINGDLANFIEYVKIDGAEISANSAEIALP